MYRLRLFGGLSLEGPDGPVTGRAGQRRPLALLALLADAGDAGLSRSRIVAYLWRDTTEKKARHLLSVALHALRKSLGSESILSVADELRLDTEHVSVDVRDFDAALGAGELEDAVALYEGPFLDGFRIRNAGGFERWLDQRQVEYARRYREVVEELAEHAEERGNWAEAVGRWRERAAAEPTNSRVAVRLMRALEATGNRPGAVEHARAHARLVREELGAEPDPRVVSLAERLTNGELEREEPTTADSSGLAPHGERALPGDGYVHGSPTSRSGNSSEGPRSPIRPIGSLPRWLASAAAGIGVVALLAGSWSALAGSFSSPSSGDLDERRVLVATLQNETQDPEIDFLGRVAADWIAEGVRETGRLRVVPTFESHEDGRLLAEEGESPGHGVAVTLARRGGARLAVTGSYSRLDDSLFFRARVVDAETGELLRSVATVAGEVDDLRGALGDLRGRVLGGLATAADLRMASWSDRASQPRSIDAYRLFAEGLDRFRYGDRQAAVKAWRQAAALDTSFTLPLLWTFFAPDSRMAKDSLRRVLEARRGGLPPFDRALLDFIRVSGSSWEKRRERYRAARRLVELAPGSEWGYKLAAAASHLGRPSEAVRILEEIDPDRGWMRSWFPYWRLLCLSYHKLGRYEDELAAAEAARKGHPRVQQLLEHPVMALAALGRVEELDAVIGEAEGETRLLLMAQAADELSAHADPSDNEITEGVRRLRHQAAEAWAAKWRTTGNAAAGRRAADQLMWLGRLEEAARIHERILPDELSPMEWTSPEFEENHLLGHRGILAALEGDRAKARSILARLKDVKVADEAESTWIPYLRAAVLAWLGEKEEAVGLLRPFPTGSNYPWAHADPRLRPLRDHPPFQELIAPRG